MNVITDLAVRVRPRVAMRDFGVLHYSNGFTSWIFRAGATPLADVVADDYFADAADMLAPGDFINVSGVDGGAILFVNEVGPGVVRTAPMAFAARGLS